MRFRNVACLAVFIALECLSTPSAASVGGNPPGNGKAGNIFAEYGGPAAHYSVNYDTRFRQGSAGWGIRIGAAFVPNDKQRIWSFPVQINYLLGKTQHFFEAGAGATLYHTNFAGSIWGIDSNDGTSVFATLSAGYRYQPVKKGITVRAGITGVAGSFLPGALPYVSIGYRF